MIFAMRLLAAWKELGTLPLKDIPRGTKEDQQFLHMFLSYYASIVNDDFALWTSEQVSYYQRHGVGGEHPHFREHYHKAFMQALADNSS